MKNKPLNRPVLGLLVLVFLLVFIAFAVPRGALQLQEEVIITRRPTTARVTATPAQGTLIPGQTATPTPTQDPEMLFREIPSYQPNGTAEVVGSYQGNGQTIQITKVTRSELVFFICDIQLSGTTQLHAGLAGTSLTRTAYTSVIAKKYNAVLAINGDFCGFGAEAKGIVIRDGVLYRDKPEASKQTLLVNPKGNFVVMEEEHLMGNALLDQGIWQSLTFGPALLLNYEQQTDLSRYTKLSTRAREPRTAIGQVGALHYIFLVVDGRQQGYSHGMTFAEVAAEMQALGCKTAYNLDGGGSTTLYFQGNVINRPCVNGQREVSDILYIGE